MDTMEINMVSATSLDALSVYGSVKDNGQISGTKGPPPPAASQEQPEAKNIPLKPPENANIIEFDNVFRHKSRKGWRCVFSL